ncbi:MAG: glutathione S-transferase family protein [Gammaproteobacteria bacterium]
MPRPTLYHIPVCPFCQRIDILLTLKGRRDDFDFQVIDITRPRPDWLLAKTRGTTALPVLETADGHAIKESLVIMQYVEDLYPEPPVARRDPWQHALEGMLVQMCGDFTAQGYGWVMNQDPAKRETLRDAMLAQYALPDDFLRAHAPHGDFLFDSFGWAEAVFTPMFQRFWFLEYYEDFALPDAARTARVRRWIDACLAHPAAQQTTREEIVKCYYDYAQGAGNGALLPGRMLSSFSLDPGWKTRPWPPRGKYGRLASDAELGLTAV